MSEFITVLEVKLNAGSSLTGNLRSCLKCENILYVLNVKKNKWNATDVTIMHLFELEFWGFVCDRQFDNKTFGNTQQDKTFGNKKLISEQIYK